VRTEDGYIISKCLNGEPEAFGFLVDKYKESVYAFAYAKLRNFHDAEDIAQEVFIKAYQKLHTLKHWDSFLAWLYSMTSNLCKTWPRSQSRRPDNDSIENNTETLGIISINSYRKEAINDSVYDVLDSLPEIHRQILTLHYLGGMKIKEIAIFLGIPSRTIARRLSESKSQLREEVLGTMAINFEAQRLPVGFTLRITEMVSRIKVQPFLPTKALPLGLSLAVGIIIAIFGLGTYFNFLNLSSVSSTPVSKIKKNFIENIHVFVSDIPQLSYASVGGGNNKGLGESEEQDAVLMAPSGEGGKIPDEPSVRMGKGTLSDIAYSPDGKILAVSTGLGIRLYDANNLEEIGILEEDKVTPGNLYFSPDGKILAIVNNSGTVITLWNMETKAKIGSINGQLGYVLSFSPDGKILASSGTWNDNTIYLFDVQSLKQIGALKGIKYISSICFSSDGKMLISAGYDKLIRLWDVVEQKQIGALEGHQKEIRKLSFSSDGKTIATSSGDENEGIFLWDIQSQKLIGTLKGHRGWINGIAFSPDGRTLASISDDQTIIVWDTLERKEIGLIKVPKDEGTSFIFSPNGQKLASTNFVEQTIRFWDIKEQKQTGTIDGFDMWLYDVAFSPDGKTIVADHNSAIKFWDVEKQKQIGDSIFTTGNDYWFCGTVAYSPDGKYVVAGTHDGKIYLIDAESKKKIDVLTGHTDWVRSLAFSPDGKLLASGSLDMTLWLWDVEQRKEIKVFRGIPHAHAVTFSPDGNYLICGIGGNGAINVWDVKTKDLINVIQPQGYVISIAISPDGKTLASGSAGSITFWDFTQKKHVKTVWGGNGNIRHLQFSPDGVWLASQSNDGTCRIWDVETKKELANLKGHKGDITGMNFSKDGKWLATCSGDGTILLWEVNIPVEGKSVNHMGKAIDTWGKIKKTDLFQNYPNPFNPETWIPFCLSEPENVKIKIYNLKGELVRTLDLGQKQPGQYTTREKSAYWDGRNENGEVVASNMYFYVMEAGDFTETKKMVLMR